MRKGEEGERERGRESESKEGKGRDGGRERAMGERESESEYRLHIRPFYIRPFYTMVIIHPFIYPLYRCGAGSASWTEGREINGGR